MRIGILSDTHGDKANLIRALQDMGEVDAIFHLGDYIKDVDYIEAVYSGDIYVVHGNCDLFAGVSDDGNIYPSEIVVTLEDKKIFATHGHRYRAKEGLNTLYYKSKEIKADIVLFGHTHCSKIICIDEMVMMNPGSISRPRNKSRSTYGIIEITNGNIKPEIVEI